MHNMIHTLWFGIREPFKKKTYVTFFIVLFLFFFVLFVLIPVWTVPANTISIQLDLFTTRDYAILLVLSSLSALYITLQGFIMRKRQSVGGASASTAAGGIGALFAGIAGTAFCVSCLAPFFALFGIGLGGVVFVLEFRYYFVVAIVLLLLIGLYLTARRIRGVCSSCA